MDFVTIRIADKHRSANALVAMSGRGRVDCYKEEVYVVPEPALALLAELGIVYQELGRTCERTMTAPATIAPTVTDFLVLLQRVHWFTRLGQPHVRDAEVVRIHDWSGWPGPEGPWGDWFGRWPAFVRECIEADGRNRSKELESTWQQIGGLVAEQAAANVPLYDPNQDAWYGPTLCVWDAAYIASLVGWHILMSQPIGWVISERWRWLAAGHWPCAFAEEPEGIDELLVEIPRVKLLVY
jgi:hypothetical protein